MAGKHDRTLEAIFAEPVRANIRWDDVVVLLGHLGAEKSQGSGSRVRFALRGVRAVFHEPHPEKEISKATVRGVRDFLNAAEEGF